MDAFLRQSIQKNQEEAQRLIRQKHQQRSIEILAKSGLGKRFIKRTFQNTITNPKNRQAIATAKAFAKTFPSVEKGLIFIGPVATGKTHLAAAIANELIDSLYTVIFGNVTDIITLIKSSYGKTELDESEIINTITDIDLLIIDDLGKEYATENTRMLLYQIINRLYENEKPVIITTNLNSDALAAKYGDRGAAIVSRITEMCDPVTLDGNDWRIRRQL